MNTPNKYETTLEGSTIVGLKGLDKSTTAKYKGMTEESHYLVSVKLWKGGHQVQEDKLTPLSQELEITKTNY
ncbi:MAG: hypothetical protein GY928_16035 [Colwellia sp.]|nr:hypothetical protein [Colwellia sp.]